MESPMLAASPILLPITVLVAWSLVMWFWMYLTRIPFIFKSKMRLDSHAPQGEQMSTLPSEIRWKADNYNHLMEQPTIFYAVTIVLALMGEGGGVNASLAWAYVGLRIMHSFVQALGNKIEVRFAVFTLSTVPLIILTINALKGPL